MVSENAAGVVAITDDMVKSPGAMVWWRLGGTIPYSKLVEAWNDAGLDSELLADSCGPRNALRRAVDEQVEKHVIRRRLPKGGWVLKVEVQDAERNDLDYRTEVKASVDGLGRLIVEPEDHRLAPEIRAAYDHALETVTSNDVTSLLVTLVDYCRGVALREGGGLYFVGPERLPEWNTMVRVLRSISGHHIYSAPAMRSADIVDAVLAGMEEEARAAADKLEADLQKDGEDALGSRALKNRAVICEALVEKIGVYERLMGTGLDVIRQRMESLKAGIVAAILSAEGEED